MEERGVLVENEKQANKSVAKVMRITFLIFSIVFLLNVLGIPEGHIGGQVGQQRHGMVGPAGKALGVGAGIIVQLLHDASHPLGGLLGNAVVAVQHLGHRGNGNPRRLGNVLDCDTHGNAPFLFSIAQNPPAWNGRGKF